MKTKRTKKAQNILSFYSTNYGFKSPYQILMDATFCQAALHQKLDIENQIMNYLKEKVKLLTCPCAIMEAEQLGAPLSGAVLILKKFFVHKCEHAANPILASKCIRSMVEKSRYIVATQDRELQMNLRKKQGQPILYFHGNSPVLEAPSSSSKKIINKKMRSQEKSIKKKLTALKESEGLPTEPRVEEMKQFKRKKPKGPNPLSCKKKKTMKVTQRDSNKKK